MNIASLSACSRLALEPTSLWNSLTFYLKKVETLTDIFVDDNNVVIVYS